MNLEDETRSERPIKKRLKQMLNWSRSLLVKILRISYSYLEEQTFLSRDTLNRIIKDKLEIAKRSSRWLPHELTLKNKLQKLEYSKTILEKFRKGEW